MRNRILVYTLLAIMAIGAPTLNVSKAQAQYEMVMYEIDWVESFSFLTQWSFGSGEYPKSRLKIQIYYDFGFMNDAQYIYSLGRLEVMEALAERQAMGGSAAGGDRYPSYPEYNPLHPRSDEDGNYVSPLDELWEDLPAGESPWGSIADPDTMDRMDEWMRDYNDRNAGIDQALANPGLINPVYPADIPLQLPLPFPLDVMPPTGVPGGDNGIGALVAALMRHLGMSQLLTSCRNLYHWQ